MASPQRAEAIRRSTTRLTNGSAWKASAAAFGGRTNQRNRPASSHRDRRSHLASRRPPSPAHATSGELKNLIFAANGPKPRIVLLDAINNVLEITENAAYCLVFDQPLTGAGLSWRELTAWWTLKQGLTGSERDRARSLYRRLDESMNGNQAERLVFKTYAELYAKADGFDLPALIPQVYLHYDPYTRLERGGRSPLVRQRMDFLLLVATAAASSLRSTGGSTTPRAMAGRTLLEMWGRTTSAEGHTQVTAVPAGAAGGLSEVMGH